MPEYEVDGVRAVYDHETEETRSGARRRPVADWGVGEELFDHMPRRRFGRPSDPGRRDQHPRERTGSARAEDFQASDASDASERPTRDSERPARDSERPTRASERPPRASERPAASRERATGAAADRLAAAPTEDLGAPAPAPAPDGPAAAPPGAPAAEPAARVDAVDGRRTIVIGRSVESTSRARRPRRPRTVGDRVGHRPDRLAMWAVALGMLLILIAILTAGA